MFMHHKEIGVILIKQENATEPVSRKILASAVAVQSATLHSGRQLANRGK